MHRRAVTGGAVGAFVIVAVVHLAAQLVAAESSFTDATQWLLMPLLAAALALHTTSPRGRLVTLVLVALGLSWLGDTAPDLADGDAAFLLLVGFFLCAQIVYIVAFAPYRGASVLYSRPWVVALYGVAVLVLVTVMAPTAGLLVVPVGIYAVCLAAMAVLATGVGRTAALGAFLFVVSDALIGVRAFVDGFDLPVAGFWIMSTYIAGQALIVWSVSAAEDAAVVGELRV